MGKLTVLDHPLVKHKITLLRSKHTDVQLFRQLMQELSMMLAYEATRSIPVEKKTCETPLMHADAEMISTEKLRLFQFCVRSRHGRRTAELHADGKSWPYRPLSRSRQPAAS
jgi:uracil phosphoribosyltransferase